MSERLTDAELQQLLVAINHGQNAILYPRPQVRRLIEEVLAWRGKHQEFIDRLSQPRDPSGDDCYE